MNQLSMDNANTCLATYSGQGNVHVHTYSVDKTIHSMLLDERVLPLCLVCTILSTLSGLLANYSLHLLL